MTRREAAATVGAAGRVLAKYRGELLAVGAVLLSMFTAAGWTWDRPAAKMARTSARVDTLARRVDTLETRGDRIGEQLRRLELAQCVTLPAEKAVLIGFACPAALQHASPEAGR